MQVYHTNPLRFLSSHVYNWSTVVYIVVLCTVETTGHVVLSTPVWALWNVATRGESACSEMCTMDGSVIQRRIWLCLEWTRQSSVDSINLVAAQIHAANSISAVKPDEAVLISWLYTVYKCGLCNIIRFPSTIWCTCTPPRPLAGDLLAHQETLGSGDLSPCI